MKKESFTSFMKQVAADLQQSGNLGTAHVYRSSLNAILVFSGIGKRGVSGNNSGVAETF